jgi:hypothetical protein
VAIVVILDFIIDWVITIIFVPIVILAMIIFVIKVFLVSIL